MSLLPETYARVGRRVCVLAMLVGSVSILSGCGFKPLYGVSPTGVDVAAELAYVAIPKRRDRLGQLIRNQLLSTMSPAGGPLDDRYTLVFTPSVSTNQLVIEPDGDVSRRLYKLSVEYRLIDTKTKKVVHRGKSFSHLAYDRTRSEFSNIQAENDMSERASIQVADDIRTRIAAYFASS